MWWLMTLAIVSLTPCLMGLGYLLFVIRRHKKRLAALPPPPVGFTQLRALMPTKYSALLERSRAHHSSEGLTLMSPEEVATAKRQARNRRKQASRLSRSRSS